MKYYPVLLNLKNKKCVVIGGGSVARRKAVSLLKAGSWVCVISPQLCPGLKRLKELKKLSWINSPYQKIHLKGAFLAIAATPEEAINIKISQDARKSGILINAVDAEDLSDFIVPSSISKGGLILSVSTSGQAPCLSKRMRRDIERLLVPEYARFLKILEGIRRELKAKCSDPKLRSRILNALCACKSSE
ncbi:MAG TPA: bifunctional precorrin-2 dehydrogenase/sirohydrochlorin ferrochelatase [Candidatus Omnitrophota bacterium]|nr:bifunctional precorrin-2 dehydrogenase/sirohydrochlorin ferrochelatase [Candidatus Omnitrophota bacterium]